MEKKSEWKKKYNWFENHVLLEILDARRKLAWHANHELARWNYKRCTLGLLSGREEKREIEREKVPAWLERRAAQPPSAHLRSVFFHSLRSRERITERIFLFSFRTHLRPSHRIRDRCMALGPRAFSPPRYTETSAEGCEGANDAQDRPDWKHRAQASDNSLHVLRN